MHMENADAALRRHCHDVARQLLVPERTFPSAASSVPAHPRTSSSGPSTTAATTNDAPTASVQRLHQIANAVALRAMTLYRLCRSPQHGIAMAPTGSGTTYATSASSSSALISGGGVGTVLADAVFCVCASVAVLQPTLWESLLWRARVVRPRSPRLMLGMPNPVPFLVKDLVNFISRSARVLSAPATVAAPRRPGPARGTAASDEGVSHGSGKKDGESGVVTGKEGSAAAPVLDELQAESIAACYFLSVSKPEERKRNKVVFQISEEVMQRRRDKLLQEREAQRNEKRQRQQKERPNSMPVRADGDRETGASLQPQGKRDATAHEAAAKKIHDSTHPLPSLTAGGLSLSRGAVLGKPGALWEHDGLFFTEEVGGRGGRENGQGRLYFAEEALEEEEGDDAEGESDAFFGAGDRRRTGTAGRNADSGSDEDGERRHAKGSKRAKRPRGAKTKDSMGDGDPETLWAKLYAAALGEDDALDGTQESDDEGGASGILSAGQRHRQRQRTETDGDGDGVERMSGGSLFTSRRPLRVMELAADVEQMRRRLRWCRMVACLSNPLLYHYEMLTQGPGYAGGPSHEDGARKAASRAEAWRISSEGEAQTLGKIFGALGSNYTSQCALTCDVVTPTANCPEGSSTESCPTRSRLGTVTAGAWLDCHPAHFLHPTRADSFVPSLSINLGNSAGGANVPVVQSPALLPSPTSVVTSTFLWTRLLVCATWLTAYADYVLPQLMQEGLDGDREATNNHCKEGPSQGSNATRSGPSATWSGATGAHGMLSPALMSTLSFCVAVVKEARQYDAICCPVCDTLSNAVTQQQQQYQRHYGSEGGGLAPSARTAPDAPLVTPMATPPVIRWGTLREERKGLARAVRPFIALATREEEDVFAWNGRHTGSAAEGGPCAGGEKELEGQRSGDQGMDGYDEDYVRHLDVPGRYWYGCWQHACRAKEPVAFARSFAPCGAPAHSADEKREASETESSGAPLMKGRDGFLEAVAQRVCPLVELLSGTFVLTPWAASCDASLADTAPRLGHGILSTSTGGRGNPGDGEERETRYASSSAHALKLERQMRQAAWMLRGLGLASRSSSSPPSLHRSGQHGKPQSTSANVDSLASLQAMTLHEAVRRALFAQLPVDYWAPMFFPPLRCSTPTTRDAAHPAKGPADEDQAQEQPSESVASEDRTDNERKHVGECASTSHEPEHEEDTRHERRRRHLRHRLKAQRQALRDLLSFTPCIPALTDADAVLECSHCFSFFHQGCVGPVQSDLVSGVFLCHTCRMKYGDRAGLHVQPFA